MPIVLLLPIILPAAIVAGILFNKREKAGKNPWVVAIVGFIISAVILGISEFLLILFAFGFER